MFISAYICSQPLKRSFSYLICLLRRNGEPIQLFCVHCNNNLRRRRPCVECHHFTAEYKTPKIRNVPLRVRGKFFLFSAWKDLIFSLIDFFPCWLICDRENYDFTLIMKKVFIFYIWFVIFLGLRDLLRAFVYFDVLCV